MSARSESPHQHDDYSRVLMRSQGFLVLYLLFLTLLGNLMLWVVMSLKFRSFLIGTCWVTSWFIELLLRNSASSSRILQATVTVTARFIKQIDRMVLVIIILLLLPVMRPLVLKSSLKSYQQHFSSEGMRL